MLESLVEYLNSNINSEFISTPRVDSISISGQSSFKESLSSSFNEDLFRF